MNLFFKNKSQNDRLSETLMTVTAFHRWLQSKAVAQKTIAFEVWCEHRVWIWPHSRCSIIWINRTKNRICQKIRTLSLSPFEPPGFLIVFGFLEGKSNSKSCKRKVRFWVIHREVYCRNERRPTINNWTYLNKVNWTAANTVTCTSQGRKFSPNGNFAIFVHSVFAAWWLLSLLQ